MSPHPSSPPPHEPETDDASVAGEEDPGAAVDGGLDEPVMPAPPAGPPPVLPTPARSA